jgi:prepilin-type N-terminal cleavage/methylation domain-containing protein
MTAGETQVNRWRPESGRQPCLDNAHGFTLVELLFSVALIATLAGIAIPAFLGGLEEARTRSAARYLAARVRLARGMAVARSKMVGLSFEQVGNDYQFTVSEDGDRDGVRTADIRSGVDPEIVSAERLTFLFRDVRFGFIEGVPAVDGDSGADAGDPIRAGASDIVSFGPLGTATSATLYIRGPNRSQYAVRIFGVTGRTRVLVFDRASRAWLER